MQIEPTIHSWRFEGKSGTLDKFLHMCAPRRCLLAPLAPAPRSPRAAAATAARCFRVACAPPASDPAAAPLSTNVPHPPLSQMRALAPVAGLADGATVAPSGVSSATPTAAAVVRRRPRVVVRAPSLSPQVVEGRLPARHARRATRRQARGRWAQRWRRWRRRRARRRCSPQALSRCVCMYCAGEFARSCTFLHLSRVHSDCTFHLLPHGGRSSAHRRPRPSREHARAQTGCRAVQQTDSV